MTATALTIMLVVANVSGAGMALPQATRLVRTRNIDGISGVWAGVSIVMNGWWLAYGLANGLWGLIPASAVGIALYLVIGFTYLHTLGRRALGPLACGAFVLGLGPLPFLIFGGWHVAGLAIGGFYSLQLAPAVVEACRRRELEGVASGTWIMAWVESAVWLVYGLVVIDPALLSGGVSGVVMSSIILVRLVLTGHRPFRVHRPAWTFA